MIAKETKSYLLQDGDPSTGRKPLDISKHIGVPWSRLNTERNGINFYATNKGLRAFQGTEWGPDLSNGFEPIYDQIINTSIPSSTALRYRNAHAKWMIYDKDFEIMAIMGQDISTAIDLDNANTGYITDNLILAFKFFQDGTVRPFAIQPATVTNNFWRFIGTFIRSRKTIGIFNASGTVSWKQFLGETADFHAGVFKLKTQVMERNGKIIEPYLLNLEAVTSTLFTITMVGDLGSSAIKVDPNDPDDTVWKRRGDNSNYWEINIGGKALLGKDLEIQFNNNGTQQFKFKRADIVGLISEIG